MEHGLLTIDLPIPDDDFLELCLFTRGHHISFILFLVSFRPIWAADRLMGVLFLVNIIISVPYNHSLVDSKPRLYGEQQPPRMIIS